ARLEEMLKEKEDLKASMHKDSRAYVMVTDRNNEDHWVSCVTFPYRAERTLNKVLAPLKTKADRDLHAETMAIINENHSYIHSTYVVPLSTLTRKYNALSKEAGNFNIFDVKKNELIDLLGKFWTEQEVVRHLKEKYNAVMPQMEVKHFKKKHAKAIDEAKSKYIVNNRDFKVAHEAGRLEVINEQLSHWLHEHKRQPSDRVSRLIMLCLEQARKEIKGNELKLEVDGTININATLHAKENLQTIFQDVNINTLILAKVAAKAGKNPLMIAHSLETSYYSKFNGFNGVPNFDEKPESPVNLIKQYNWSELEGLHREMSEKERKSRAEIQDAYIVEDSSVQSEIKTSLLASLKKTTEFRK
ncbi:hypothetical protein KY328_02100, partial [Candidatus Woesearchaeota archaeon]|nr:hypothetical protein [Candidatus Woesearchaeota archaeon]